MLDSFSLMGASWTDILINLLAGHFEIQCGQNCFWFGVFKDTGNQSEEGNSEKKSQVRNRPLKYSL